MVNKKGISTLEGEWRLVPEGDMFCIENAENNKVLSLASNSEEETEVKEMFRDNKLRQLWKIGTPNEEGFFTITEAFSNKVLIGIGAELKIDGKLLIELCFYFIFFKLKILKKAYKIS